MLKIGIIGLGRVSTFYVDAIRASRRLELHAVCDTDIEVLEPYRRKGFAAHDDLATLLADDELDAVVVDTPVTTHVEISTTALEAGKHVGGEKPLALTRVDAARVHELAATRDRTLFTAFHRRYNRNLPDPNFVDLDEIAEVEVAYLERIQEHAGRGNWHMAPADEGGGVIVDNGPNSFAVVSHLFGNVSATSAEVERSPTGVDMSAVLRGRLGDRDTDVVFRLDWNFEGERKDVVIRRETGAETRIDLLSGFPGFKSSLHHEYQALLDHFAHLIQVGRQDPMGQDCTAWLEDALTLSLRQR